MRRREFLIGAALSGALPIIAQESPSSAGPRDRNLLEDLVAAYRILAREGVLDAFGHVSVRHNRDNKRYLLSRSLAPALVGEEDFIEYDLDSNAVDAQGRSQYSERFIHGEIYKARRDVNAVVHSHSPSVVPFSVSTVPMRPVYHMAAFIGDGLPIFDIRKAAGITDMLVSNTDRGRALVQALASRPAVLMRGHGVAVVGASLPFAVGRSIYLELNARLQMQAIGLGGRITYLDPEEAKKVLEAGENRGYERAWELWKREVTVK
jgi:ribulose-5-phosphate 4-epimerase/fuculose-1-phosphate aldolase